MYPSMNWETPLLGRHPSRKHIPHPRKHTRHEAHTPGSVHPPEAHCLPGNNTSPHYPQPRRQLQRTVCIPLEYILVIELLTTRQNFVYLLQGECSDLNSLLFDCLKLTQPKNITDDHSIYLFYTRYSDHPAGCVIHSEVSALPVGCMSQSEVSVLPVGCMNQSEVSALPAGCMNQSEVRALSAGCMNQSEVSALPAGCMNQSEVRALSAGCMNQSEVRALSAGCMSK